MTLPPTDKLTAEFHNRKLGLRMLTSKPKGTGTQSRVLHSIFQQRKDTFMELCLKLNKLFSYLSSTGTFQ